MNNSVETPEGPLKGGPSVATAPGSTESLEDASERRRRRMRVWLPALIVLTILLAGAWHDRMMVDDAFIHLRVVKQIEAGHGPVFNAGERVEASTSPAWTYLLLVLDLALPLRLEWIAVLTGIALTAAGICLAVLGAAELSGQRGSGGWRIPAGAGVFCVLPAAWINASTGLENGLVYAWLGACLYVLARWCHREARATWAEVALLGFGPLVRPELLLFSGAFLAVVVVFEARARGRVRALSLIGAGLAVPFAYEIFRMGYYASLVPNSAIAKEASLSYWSSGLQYLHGTVDPYWLPIPLVLIVLIAYAPLVAGLHANAQHRALATTLTFAVIAVLNAAFVIRVGGDIFHARLLLTPLFAFLAPVMVIPWRRAYAGAALLTLWAMVVIVALRSGGDNPVFFTTQRNPIVLSDFPMLTFAPTARWFDGSGVYDFPTRLRATPSPGKDPAVAAYGVGALGYALGPNVYVLDLLGLGDALTSHLHLGTSRGPLVAHEKPLPPPWIAARLAAAPNDLQPRDFPIPGFIGAESDRRLDTPSGEPFDVRVDDARRALQCGELKNLMDAISKPLTTRRFFDNIEHATGFTTLRIPAEPRKAVARFCNQAASSGLRP